MTSEALAFLASPYPGTAIDGESTYERLRPARPIAEAGSQEAFEERDEAPRNPSHRAHISRLLQVSTGKSFSGNPGEAKARGTDLMAAQDEMRYWPAPMWAMRSY